MRYVRSGQSCLHALIWSVLRCRLSLSLSLFRIYFPINADTETSYRKREIILVVISDLLPSPFGAHFANLDLDNSLTLTLSSFPWSIIFLTESATLFAVSEANEHVTRRFAVDKLNFTISLFPRSNIPLFIFNQLLFSRETQTNGTPYDQIDHRSLVSSRSRSISSFLLEKRKQRSRDICES